MVEKIEIRKFPFVRTVAVIGFVLVEIMLLASLVCVASIAAHGWRADRGALSVMAVAIWGRGLFIWVVMAIGVAIYNWTASRFGGITMEISERKAGNEQ